MSTHLVTFSDESMSRAADLCIKSALRHDVDKATAYTRDWLLTTDFFCENKQLFDDRKRGGGGYFAWKPFIILQTMERCQEGDILIYSDAGVEFIDNQKYIIDRMDQDIFLFGNNWEHAHWCKKDVTEAIWPHRVVSAPEPVSDNPSPWGPEYQRTEWRDFGKQCQASVIFFRVSDYTREFVAEWLKWCLFEGGVLIDDSPSRLPNHPEFQEHRHDQAILTTMAYREGLRLHWWPAVYNRGGSPEFVYEKLPEYAGDDYPILFHHHRRRNHEWSNAA